MAARFTIQVLGLAELRARFSPANLHREFLLALPVAFEHARSAVQAAAPRGQTGRLARRITTRVSDRADGIVVTIRSGAGYGHLVESGHRMVVGGRIPRGRTLGARLREGRTRGRVVGQVPPHPFAEPAFRATEDTVIATLERILAERLGSP